MGLLPKYIKTIFSNNTDPAINESNKNKVENQLEYLTDQGNGNFTETQENKGNIATLESRLSNAIGKDSLSEVQDARVSDEYGAFPTLKDRCDNTDSKLANPDRSDANRFVGSTKPGDVFNDDVSNYTILNATGSNDTTNVKIGSQAIRATFGASATNPVIRREGVNLDFTKLLNGETSPDSDFVKVALYVSNVSALSGTNVSLALSQGATYDGANVIFLNIPVAGLSNGWNYPDLKKSINTTIGSGSFSGIQSWQIQLANNAGFSGEYITAQLFYNVKADPIDPNIPNALQENDKRIALMEAGELYVGPEFGVNKIKFIDGVNPSLSFVNQYSSFTAIAKVQSRGGNDAGRLVWNKVGTDIKAEVNNSVVNLLGIDEGTRSAPMSISNEDFVTFKLHVDSGDVTLFAYKNNEPIPVIIKGTTTPSIGNIKIADFNIINPYDIDFVSTTELNHAATASFADEAGSLNAVYKNGAFAVDELPWGTYGLDTSNGDVYFKISGNQMIQVNGVIV